MKFSVLPRVLPTSKWQSEGGFTSDDQWVTNQKLPHGIGMMLNNLRFTKLLQN